MAWPLGLAGTGLGALAFERGRRIARRRQAELRAAAEAAAVRNRELELLRVLGAALLTFQDSDELFAEVAKVARDLVGADAGAVLLRSDEGQFLRIAAASGELGSATGRLLTVEGSLIGPALAGEPVTVERASADPRFEPIEGVVADLDRIAAVPLVSRGSVLGAVAVANRARRPVFGPLDLEALATLAEQVAIGLDRAAMLDEARRNERILEQTNRELIEATALRTQFLANMSHELRTPLNAIIGFADLLQSDPKRDEADLDYLESIARNGRHLLELINGVLDAAKLEAGRMALRLAPFDLHATVTAAVQDTDSLRAIKRQRCTVDLGPDPVELVADQQKVRQVLFNLLANASKFTDSEGTVEVQATRTPMPLPVRGADGGVAGVRVRDAVWLAVRDNGVGIRSEDLGRLFQPFSQLDSSTTRSQPGTGLGLALCKQFVELHGGTIGVESVVGQGSTFWLVLPIEGPEAPR